MAARDSRSVWGKVEHAAWKVESFQLKVERERREVEAVDGIRS